MHENSAWFSGSFGQLYEIAGHRKNLRKRLAFFKGNRYNTNIGIFKTDRF